MSNLQIQARALGDPTRHAIFRYLVDADAEVGVAELTDHVGLNHNAVRQHLAKLVDAELVVGSTAAPGGRGRPRLTFRVDPRADGRWVATSPYERLAVLLTEVVRSGDDPVDVGRRAGRRHRIGTNPAAEPVEALVDEMARQGFDPVVRPTDGGIDITLQTCPFTSAVLADPGTICELHLGLALGMAEAFGGLEIDELVPRDPRRANCRLRCRTMPPDGPASQPTDQPTDQPTEHPR